MLQLSNYLKVPISYFFDSYAEYTSNLDKTAEGFMSVNYGFLARIYSDMTQEQKSKFIKLVSNETDITNIKNIKTGWILAPRAGLEPATNWLTVNCSTNWATEE